MTLWHSAPLARTETAEPGCCCPHFKQTRTKRMKQLRCGASVPEHSRSAFEAGVHFTACTANPIGCLPNISMYVYICIYLFIYLFMYLCIKNYIYTYIHTHTHILILIHVHMRPACKGARSRGASDDDGSVPGGGGFGAPVSPFRCTRHTLPS